MPSKITLSNEEKQNIISKFLEQLQNTLNSNFEGTESISLKIPKMETVEPSQKPKIIISTQAGLKMSELVTKCSKEVGWHGFVDRIDDYTFIITDIIVYPQTVTGATVTTDELEYALWLNNFKTEEINKIRFQGHSHVNMHVSPSATDTALYNNYLVNLKNDDFYIFFICNKRGEINAFLYDLKTNTKYTKEDLEIVKETDMSAWYDTVKENIKEILPKQQTPTHFYYDDMEHKAECIERNYYGTFGRKFDDDWDARVERVNANTKKTKTTKNTKGGKK